MDKIRELEGRILGFRTLIKIESVHTPEIALLLALYDDWFGITSEREERV
ncbi:MAG: hypothetical protein WCP46_00535 [Alphaproteobacteria bacterium]